jgi:hypothetical protein
MSFEVADNRHRFVRRLPLCATTDGRGTGPSGGNAASTDVGDDHCIALEGPVSGVNLTLEWIELDPNCIVGNH